MNTFNIPDNGVVLPIGPTPSSAEEGMTRSQIIQLDLENGMLHEMMKAARHGGKHSEISFGKTMSLHYGAKTRTLKSSPVTFPSFLYTHSVNASPECTFTGQITHRVGPEKIPDDLSGTDAALESLQKSLASAKEAKQSNQIKFLAHETGLPRPQLHKSGSSKQPPSKGRSFTPLSKNNQPTKSNDVVSQSLPSSPAMAPLRPPVVYKMKEDAKSQRSVGIRQSTVHLLATRPLSLDEIVKTVKGKKEEVNGVLKKIADLSMADRTKWNLKDRSYKELDVWLFPYSDTDREKAIARAVEAYGRLRLGAYENEFQRLLPVKDRGKGKTLSKHEKFQQGPIKPNSTPRIQVQHHDKSDKPKHEGSRNDHAASTEQEPERRSKSQGPSPRRRPKDRMIRARDSLKNEKNESGNAIKGRKAEDANKKKNKKAAAALSAEFVHDSEEEDGFDEAVHQETQSPRLKPTTNISTKEPSIKKERAKPRDVARTSGSTLITNGNGKRSQQKDPASKEEPGSLRENSGSQQSMKKSEAVSATKRKALNEDSSDESPFKRPRKGSSTHKPSPLGSSPPTNASEIEEKSHSTSSSSSPLISAKAMVNGARSQSDKHEPKNLSRNRKSIEPDRAQIASSGTARNMMNGVAKGSKRPKTGELTPPSSDSTSPPTKSARIRAIERAEEFKTHIYPKYQRLHQELEKIEFPSAEKMAELERLREHVAETKRSIVEDFEALHSEI